MAPNKIQPRDYSSGGDPDGFRYGPLGSKTNVNGNRNVAYLWNDDNGRNLNLNWIDNDWNDNYRFLAVRISLHVYLNTLILWMGVFRLQVFLPTSDILPDFIQGTGDCSVFFMV